MLKKKMTKLMATLLVGAVVVTASGLSVWYNASAEEVDYENVPAETHLEGFKDDPLYKQIAKDSMSAEPKFRKNKADIFLMSAPLGLKKGESVSASDLDRRFAKTPLKKVKGSVTVTPLISYKDSSKNPVAVKDKTTITAVSPAETAVKIKYTYHKKKTIKVPVKKGKKKKFVKKQTFTKKTYTRVWLLEIVSCYDTDEFMPESQELESGDAADAVYNQKNYVALRQLVKLASDDSVQYDEDEGDDDFAINKKDYTDSDNE